jgi:hypothetical protein
MRVLRLRFQVFPELHSIDPLLASAIRNRDVGSEGTFSPKSSRGN